MRPREAGRVNGNLKVYWSWGTPTPYKKIFIADMDELENVKKVVKMSTFWDDPPPQL